MLPGSDGLPLAIVEAKRASRDAIAGKEQARLYVEAITRDTGARPLIYLANGDEIWFWDLVSNPRLVSGFGPRDDLERRQYQRDYRQPLATRPINAQIVDRPYQQEAIRRVHEALTAGKRRGLLAMATGTGKTRVATALVDTLLGAGWAQRVLFLADRDALVEQALSEGFKAHLPAEPAARIRSSAYDPTKRLYVATLQTMQDFHRHFSPTAFDPIIADECHRSIYNRWQDVLTYFDSYLIGLTATQLTFSTETLTASSTARIMNRRLAMTSTRLSQISTWCPSRSTTLGRGFRLPAYTAISFRRTYRSSFGTTGSTPRTLISRARSWRRR